MERSARSRNVVVAASFILLSVAGCDLAERFKTCEDAEIILLNSEQTRVAVNMIGPDEVFAQENLLESGQSRRIVICMDRGDRKRFQVRQGTQIVASVNCVPSRESYVGHPQPTVTWTQDDLLCENW